MSVKQNGEKVKYAKITFVVDAKNTHIAERVAEQIISHIDPVRNIWEVGTEMLTESEAKELVGWETNDDDEEEEEDEE